MITGWGALSRLAWRDARRHPARATLVSLLIAVPVAGVVAAGTLSFTVRPSASELAQQALGDADIAVYRTDVVRDPSSLAERLPAGSRIAPLWRGEIALSGTGPAAGRRIVETVGVDLDGLGAGMFQVLRGHPPEPGTDEIAVTVALAGRLGIGVGSRVDAGPRSVHVAGVVRDATALDREAAVFPPDAAPDPSGALIELPDPAAAGTVARSLERAGWDAATRADMSRSDPEQILFILVLGGFGLLVTSQVSAAAFAVSAQRRRHELALLAASGAEPRQLRHSVLASAGLLGAVGAGGGLLLGILVSAATLPWLEGWTDRAIDGLTVVPSLLLAAATVGLLTAIASSWLTARAAGRTPVAAALTGRRPPRTSSVRPLVIGAVSAIVGVALTVVTASAATNGATDSDVVTAAGLLAGAGMTMLGLGATSPWLVEHLTRRIGTSMPVGIRLAMRDTARFRSRTGPIVMAIVAGLGLSVAVGATLDSIESGLARGYRPQLAPDQLLVDGPAPVPLIDRLRETLPVRAAAPLTIVRPAAPSTHGRPLPQVVTIADSRLLDALELPASSRAAIDAGQVLVLQDPQGRRDSRTTMVDQAGSVAPNGVRLVELALVPRAVPPILLSRATFDRSGAVPAREATRWLLRLAAPVSDEQVRRAHDLADTFGQRVTVETGPPDIDSTAIQSAATGGAAFVSLLIVAIGLALIGAETRHDGSILTAVGADPGVRRTLAAARAGSLTLLGALLAVPAGLLPVWGLTAAAQNGAATTGFTVPVTSVVVMVMLLPAIAATGAWALTPTGRSTLTPRAP